MSKSKWPRIKWNQANIELANKAFEDLFKDWPPGKIACWNCDQLIPEEAPTCPNCQAKNPLSPENMPDVPTF